MYFNQLLGAARTRKLVETLFFSHCQPFLFIQIFFSDFTPEINKKINRLKTFEVPPSGSQQATVRLKCSCLEDLNHSTTMAGGQKIWTVPVFGHWVWDPHFVRKKFFLCCVKFCILVIYREIILSNFLRSSNYSSNTVVSSFWLMTVGLRSWQSWSTT